MISRRKRMSFRKPRLLLLVFVASLLNVQMVPVGTAALDADVRIRHEHDLGEYDRVVQDGNHLAQSHNAALGGTQGGLQVTIDDDTAVYGEKTFGALSHTTAYRFRHYVDPNGLPMPDRSEITLTQLRRRSNKVETRLQYAADCYRLYVRYVDDNGTWHSLPIAFISDAGHYVEVLVEFASSPSAYDGRITYWIDDLAIGQHRYLDLYDTFRRPDHLRLGAPWVSDPTIRGTLYVDEFVLRNGAEYIGPEDTKPTMPATTPPATSAEHAITLPRSQTGG